VVSLCTAANLTYKSDKLSVISTIARTMAKYNKTITWPFCSEWTFYFSCPCPQSPRVNSTTRLATVFRHGCGQALMAKLSRPLPTNPTMLAELDDVCVTSPVNDPFVEVNSGLMTVSDYLNMVSGYLMKGIKMPYFCLIFAGNYTNLGYYFSDYAREGLELLQDNIYCLPIY
jgi:hypothetical protein